MFDPIPDSSISGRLVEEFQGWERRSGGKFTILLVFLCKRRRWVFSFLNNTLQASDLPTFRGFFSLIFPTKRIFEPTVLLLKKAARCQPFLAVVRCLFHNHLRLKRSSLLNVYLNYTFEISFLTFHLFFSLFIFTVSFWNIFQNAPKLINSFLSNPQRLDLAAYIWLSYFDYLRMVSNQDDKYAARSWDSMDFPSFPLVLDIETSFLSLPHRDKPGMNTLS